MMICRIALSRFFFFHFFLSLSLPFDLICSQSDGETRLAGFHTLCGSASPRRPPLEGLCCNLTQLSNGRENRFSKTPTCPS